MATYINIIEYRAGPPKLSILDITSNDTHRYWGGARSEELRALADVVFIPVLTG